MTDAAPPAVAVSTCAIRAQDFDNVLTDYADRWTAGKMRHLVDALQDAPVLVVVDRRTGYALLGARLTYCGPARPGRVNVECTLEDGTTQVTAYFLADIGDTIVPLSEDTLRPGGGPRWRALRAYQDEVSAAIASARRLHGESAGRAWGAWTGICGEVGVSVRYQPHTGNPAFADRWGTRWSGLVIGDQVNPY